MVTTYVHIADSAAGGSGGTITVGDPIASLDANGEPISDAPRGTCSVRWRDPGVWFWSNNGVPVQELPRSSTHGSPPELSFSGPYSGCDAQNYHFPHPLTETGHAPFDMATTLAVHVLRVEDIEFLDESSQVLDFTPPGGEEPPDPVGFCELTPEFCLDPEFTLDDPCNSPAFMEICSGLTATEVQLVRLRDLVAVTEQDLDIALQHLLTRRLPRSAGRQQMVEAVGSADRSLMAARKASRILADERTRRIDMLGREAAGSLLPVLRAAFHTATELAVEGVDHVSGQVRAISGGGEASPSVLQRAVLACRHVRRECERAMTRSVQLRAWALAEEDGIASGRTPS